MNGKSVIYSGDALHTDALIDIAGNAELVIDGNGSFTFDDNYLEHNSFGYTYRLFDQAKLTINSGYFKAGLTCVQLDNSSQCEITGGVFEAYSDWNDVNWILNLIDNCDGKSIVKGGTFKDYNPAESKTENPVANFVADGYLVNQTEKDGSIWYEVLNASN